MKRVKACSRSRREYLVTRSDRSRSKVRIRKRGGKKKTENRLKSSASQNNDALTSNADRDDERLIGTWGKENRGSRMV
jgi:hypothetical protein